MAVAPSFPRVTGVIRVMSGRVALRAFDRGRGARCEVCDGSGLPATTLLTIYRLDSAIGPPLRPLITAVPFRPFRVRLAYEMLRFWCHSKLATS